MSWALLGPSSTVFCGNMTQSHQNLSSSGIESRAALAKPIPHRHQQFPHICCPWQAGLVQLAPGTSRQALPLADHRIPAQGERFLPGQLATNTQESLRASQQIIAGRNLDTSPAARLSQAGT